MKSKALVHVVAIAVLVTLVLVSCVPVPAPVQPPAKPSQSPTSSAEAPAPSSGFVMVMNMDDLITLDPHQAYETTNVIIHASTYDTLVEVKPDDLNRVVPRLADRWEVSDDKLVYTFHLHPGVKFASGNPVTAEDVRFSWMRLKNLKGNPSFYADIVKDAQVVDGLTVRVTLKEPALSFLSICAAPAMAVLDSKLVKEHGGTDAPDADKTDKARDWLDQHSAGSGPFVQVEWKPEAEIVMEANPDYWRGKPELNRIVIKHVADSETALQMLSRGDADLLHSLDADLLSQAQGDPNLKIVVGQMLTEEYLAMTSSADLSKPLSDTRVRQAIVKAIDYEAIIKDLLRGYAVRSSSVIPIGIVGAEPPTADARDLDGARMLLREAGYEEGFTVDLAYGSNATRELVAPKIKSDLADVDITVSLRPLEETVYLTEMRAQKLPFAYGIWAPDYIDPTMWTDYFSYHDQGIAERMLYNNPEAERYARIVASESDSAKREEAIKALEGVWLEDAAFTMLYQAQQIVVMNKKVSGFAYHPIQFVNFFDLSE